MRGYEFAQLEAFVAVVEEGSFVRAAKHLQIAPSSLSQTIRRLEERLGVELLQRTTRSVSMTGAGTQLFSRFRPAMAEMQAAVTGLRELSVAPAGLVRLHVPRPAYASLLESRLGKFHRMYPQVYIDAVIDDSIVNMVAAGFDLDVRLAGIVDPATSAMPISGPVRHVAVASPAYLAECGTPEAPADLRRHRCIQWRRPETEHPYQWVFQVDGAATAMDVDGPLIVSHCDIAVTAARDAVGIAYVLEQHALAALMEGAVRPLLSRFMPPFAGWTVCHPSRTTLSAAARAIVEFLATPGSQSSLG